MQKKEREKTTLLIQKEQFVLGLVPLRSTHEPNSLIFYTSKLKRRLCSCPSWVEWSPIIFSRCSKRVRWVEDLMVFFLSFHSRFWIVTKSAALLATMNWAKIQFFGKFLDLYRVILKRGLGTSFNTWWFQTRYMCSIILQFLDYCASSNQLKNVISHWEVYGLSCLVVWISKTQIQSNVS